MVIFSHLSFSFIHLNEDSWLVVSIGGENLRFFGRDSGVSGDKVGHNSSGGFNS